MLESRPDFRKSSESWWHYWLVTWSRHTTSVVNQALARNLWKLLGTRNRSCSSLSRCEFQKRQFIPGSHATGTQSLLSFGSLRAPLNIFERQSHPRGIDSSRGSIIKLLHKGHRGFGNAVRDNHDKERIEAGAWIGWDKCVLTSTAQCWRVSACTWKSGAGASARLRSAWCVSVWPTPTGRQQAHALSHQI